MARTIPSSTPVHWQSGKAAFLLLLLPMVLSLPFGLAQTIGQSVSQSSTPNLPAILAGMEQAQLNNRLRWRAYTMTREYRLYASTEEPPKSEVTAEINFMPPAEKTYKIDRAEGNDRGKMVVQHILSSEAEASRVLDAPAAVVRQNYDFFLEGEQSFDGHSCWVLRMKPKREEKSLIDGQAWVDKSTYRLRQIDGDMAKNPSWWVKRVHVTITYGDAAGMWLQTGTRAVADIRLVGRHTLISEAVDIRTAEEVASLQPGSALHNGSTPLLNRRRHVPVVGTGVLVKH